MRHNIGNWMREHWSVLASVFWKRWLVLGSAFYFAAGVYDWLVGQIIPDSWEDKARLGNNVPDFTFWQWATVAAVFLLLIVFEATVKHHRDTTAKQGELLAQIDEMGKQVPASMDTSVFKIGPGANPNIRFINSQIVQHTLPQVAGSTPDFLLADVIEDRVFSIYSVPRDGVFIRRKTFRRCVINGPALITLMGSQTSVRGLNWGGSTEQVLWEVPPERSEVTGVIVLEDCVIEGGSMNAIGVAGSPDLIRLLRQSNLPSQASATNSE